MLFFFKKLMSAEATCYLDSALAHSHSLFWSDVDNSPVGGIGIAVSKKFLGLFTIADFVIIEPGRIACLGMKGPLGGLTLWSVHLDHNEASDKRLVQISLLGDATADGFGSHHLLGGDFNFTMGLEDRLNPADGAFFVEGMLGRWRLGTGAWATWWSYTSPTSPGRGDREAPGPDSI